MPDSEKLRVVIASVLKPPDDSRMYEKIGLTLAGSGRCTVYVIGMGKTVPDQAGVIQHALKPFGRISLPRLFAPWRILSKAMSLRPHLFIITTHELLWIALILKAIRRCRLIYDVQENYYWNILYTGSFPLLLKPFVALYVRAKENITARFVDHFLLAEKRYAAELKFPGMKSTVIENKLRGGEVNKLKFKVDSSKLSINLIFSGTIAEVTGVFTAIDLAIKLHVIDDRIRLVIVGYCAQKKTLEKIRLLIQPRPFIQLIAGPTPVPHTEILKYIRQADFGLVTYQVNPSTSGSIPTKLYEYLGFHLPILLTNHKPWVEFCEPSSAAVVFNPLHYNAGDIYREMMSQTFYTAPPEGVYWSSEEPKLLKALEL
jgi:glycosyltransferase involved in cell wall biosynthesis